MSTTDIIIKVTGKIATTMDAPVIVCGNSDYRIYFKFDQEWETSNAKTARFVFRRSGKIERIEVAFTGTVVGVPVLSGIDEVYVGVYAGELHTTTPARVICKRSILCLDAEEHEAPAPDVYQQILATMNNLDTLPTVTSYEAGKALMVNENGRWVVRLPNFIYDQNSGELMTFFIGTVAEYEEWTGEKDKCIFFPLDFNVLDDVENAFKELQEEHRKDVEELRNSIEAIKNTVNDLGEAGGVWSTYETTTTATFDVRIDTEEEDYTQEIQLNSEHESKTARTILVGAEVVSTTTTLTNNAFTVRVSDQSGYKVFVQKTFANRNFDVAGKKVTIKGIFKTNFN